MRTAGKYLNTLDGDMMTLIQRTVAAASLAVYSLFANVAYAETFPEKPITVVLPYVAGSLGDIMARVLGEEISQTLKQPVIVDNKPGVAEVVGLNHLYGSQPNGYSLLVTFAPNIIPNSVQAKLPYKSLSDFTVVTKIASMSGVLCVGNHIAASNVKELVALLKSQPDRLTYGTSGLGSPNHLGAALFSKMTETRAVQVPFRGLQQVATELVSGRLDYAILSVGMATQFAKEGKLKIIGTQMLQRFDELPEVPTLDEQGLKGYEAPVSILVLAPKGTPAPIVEKLNQAFNAAVSSPSYATKMRTIGGVIIPKPATSAETTIATLKEEAHWRALVKEMNITLE